MVSLNLILGPIQVGYSVATFLYGLTTVQTYIYYQDFNDDPSMLKSLVAAVWLVELAHQICCSHAVYFYTITSFGRLDILGIRPPPSIGTALILSGLTTLLVSVIFVYHWWRSRKQVVIVALLAVLLACGSVSSIVLGGYTFDAHSLRDFLKNSRPLAIVTWASGAAGDVILAIALCHDFHTRRRSAIPRTTSITDLLIARCVATGAVTSILAVALTICFITMPENLVWIAIYLPLSRFSFVALLASLNARITLRAANSSKAINVEPFHATRGGNDRTEKSDGNLAVQVAIVSETVGDDQKAFRTKNDVESASTLQ